MRGRSANVDEDEDDEEREAKLGRMAASRWAEGVVADEVDEVEKVCMRGLGRLAMEGWGVGRWVVVRERVDCGGNELVSYYLMLIDNKRCW
jgi:hypothetical protein